MTMNLSVRFANMSLLGAVFVVLIHVFKRAETPGTLVSALRYLTGEGLCRTAVPFFFLAAGYFIARHVDEPGYWPREVRKRIRTLLVPFYVWSLIAFVLCSGLIIAGNLLAGQPVWEGVFAPARLLMASGLNPCHVPELRQLWFMRVLFVLVLLLPIWARLTRQWFLVAGVFVSYLLIKPYGGRLFGPDLHYAINYGFFSFEGIAYFLIGFLLRRKHCERVFANWKIGLVSLFLGLGFMAGLGLIPRFALLILLVSIPLMLHGLLTLMSDRPFPLQGYSFPIYLIHLSVVFVYFFALDNVKYPWMKWFDPGMTVSGALVCTTVVLAFSLALAKALKLAAARHPRVGQAFFGGR